MVGMSLRRPAVAVVLLSAALAACAPPSPDEGVREASDAISGPGEQQQPERPVLMSGLSFARLDPATATIEEKVVFDQPQQAARVCYAYLEGTEEQRRACDDYPTNYVDMTCTDGPSTFPHLLFDPPTGPITQCVGRRPVGAAPIDEGDGEYQAYFVSVKDPTKRLSVVPSGSIIAGSKLRTPEVTSDFFQLYLDVEDVRRPNDPVVIDRQTFVEAVREAPGAYFGFRRVRSGPHITIEMRRDLVAKVRGCAGGFSKVGLSPEQLAAKTAELRASCARPDVQVDGREGWTTLLGTPNADRAQIKFDASPLLGRETVMLVAFEVEGRVRQYQFESLCLAGTGANDCF